MGVVVPVAILTLVSSHALGALRHTAWVEVKVGQVDHWSNSDERITLIAVQVKGRVIKCIPFLVDTRVGSVRLTVIGWRGRRGRRRWRRRRGRGGATTTTRLVANRFSAGGSVGTACKTACVATILDEDVTSSGDIASGARCLRAR